MSDQLICGLDLSTSVAGYCRMNGDGEIESYDFYKFDKPSDYQLIDLVDQWDEHVWPHIEDADVVVLEDSLKKYAGGFSSKATITKLLRFNGIIEYELQRRLGKDRVKKVHPSTAKKQALGRGRVPSDYDSPWSTYKDSKAWPLERVSEIYEGVDWEMTHSGNPRPGSDDAADSIVLARSYVESQ